MSPKHDAKPLRKCPPEAPEAYRDTPELAAAWKEGHWASTIGISFDRDAFDKARKSISSCDDGPIPFGPWPDDPPADIHQGMKYAVIDVVGKPPGKCLPTDLAGVRKLSAEIADKGLEKVCLGPDSLGRPAGAKPPCLGKPTTPPRILTPPELATVASGLLLRDGGFTIDERGIPQQSVADLWAVSVKGKGKIYAGHPSVNEISAYLREYPLDGQWFGGWYNKATGETCLDQTMLFGYRHTAIMVAEKNDQKSIYNLATGETVKVAGKSRGSHHYDCKCGTSFDAVPGPTVCPNCLTLCRLSFPK